MSEPHAVFTKLKLTAKRGQVNRFELRIRLHRRQYTIKIDHLHTSEVMKKHYLDLSDEEFAEAAEASLAGLESPVPHAHDHAMPTDLDGL